MQRRRALLAMLVALVVTGCTVEVSGSPSALPVTLEAAPGWTTVPPLARSVAAAAESAPSLPVRRLLRFYASRVDDLHDLGGVVLTASGTGAAVLAQQSEVETPLDQLADRLAAEATQLGAPTTAGPARIGEVDGWRLDEAADEQGLSRVQVWFDHRGRWSVDVLAPAADVDSLLAAVRIA